MSEARKYSNSIAVKMMRALIFVVLLFSLLPTQVNAEKFKRQKFPKGSPEAVVEALMYYDLTNKMRTEDTPNNPYRPFAPELVGQPSYDPLSECGYVMAFIDSYRILGGKPRGVENQPTDSAYYVSVEAVVRGVEVHRSLLPPSDIKCGWLGLKVRNRQTGVMDEIFRDNVDGDTKLLGALEQLGRPVEADMGDKRYVIDPVRRLWSFEVSLVRDVASKRWILKMPIIPYHIALLERKATWRKIAHMTQTEIDHCAGRKPRPKWWTWQECDQKELERHLKSDQLGTVFIHHMEQD